MDYSILLEAPLFRNISLEEIRAAMSAVPHRIKRFNTGTLIAQNGDKVNSLMIVIKGTVKGEMVDYAGRVIKIEDIPAPGALASAFIFGSRNMFPVNVVALSETELLVIEKTDFLKLLKNNEKVLINFMDMISNRSQFLSRKIKFLNFKTIGEKLAQYILQSAGDGKTETILNMTQNELADFFGVARPSVGRALGELESKGLIYTKGRYIKILDMKRLSDLTRE
jgi:CRP-like cAMP-binding protein